ncbi:unnamed protein product [Linum tenue]|uniref:Subtilisin-like protease SBT1.4 n=1 Tax=Linum tenue TaxID=586396 RepID=A0AAV0K9X1_9ROSI|nr:unnamed protein product [Linum tenue]
MTWTNQLRDSQPTSTSFRDFTQSLLPFFSSNFSATKHSCLSPLTATMAAAAAIFLFLLISSAAAAPEPRPQTFIVHVSQSHKPALFSSHRDWYASILPHPSALLYTYSHAAAGFSASLTADQASRLLRTPGILSVVPDQIRHLHTTHTPSFLGLSPSSPLSLNSANGDGVIIGVLDTGIWPLHPSFDDAAFPAAADKIPAKWRGVCESGKDFPAAACNRKLIGARAFYKGYESYRGRPIDETKESKSPKDTEGHGTHTASTAGGSVVTNASLFGYAAGDARGLAPSAWIAAYKICWSPGCFDSDILAAFDQAVDDGVDVISLSVGGSYPPPYDSDSIAIGAFAAAKKGIVVSCSAGNSGPGAYTATNIAPWILTVGASTVDRDFPADVVLGDGSVHRGVSLYGGDGLPEGELLPLVYSADCGSRYCYSGNLDPAKVKGKIVLCDRGGNARVEKGASVKLAGGAGMIMANTDLEGDELLADAHLIPATMVGATEGDKIRAYIQSAESPSATIQFRGTVIGEDTPPAPKVASFSSRGPNRVTPEILKPDVIAPGVNILAGWTGAAAPSDLEIDPRRVTFNIISGTSMSCPHVSGLAALLKGAHPDWSPAAIKSAMITTATTFDNSGENINDLATGKGTTPFVYGAGHVVPNAAVSPGLVYDLNTTDYVSFLCSSGYSASRIAVIFGEPIASDVCEHAPALTAGPGDLNYPSFSVVFKPKSDVVTYKRVVKNVGSSVDAVYEIKVNAPVNVDVQVSPTKLVFNKESSSLAYEITFSSSVVGFDNGAASQSFGFVEWSDGVHKVRSPIAVQWRQGGSVESI